MPSYQSADVVPAGDYKVVLTDAVLKQAETGAFGSAITLQIVEGPHAGSKITDYITIHNPASETAVAIGRSKLKEWSAAAGVHPSTINGHLTALRGKLVGVYVKLQPEGTYRDKKSREMKPAPAKNRIGSFKPVANAAPPPQGYAPPAPTYVPVPPTPVYAPPMAAPVYTAPVPATAPPMPPQPMAVAPDARMPWQR